MTRLLFIQNAEFEEPGYLAEWAKEEGVPFVVARPFQGEPLPDPQSFSHLVVLGCPESVTELERIAWLKEEAKYLQNCLASRQKILGLCFGAQLLAHLLGGEVRAGVQPELGWHPFTLSEAALRGPLARLPKTFPLFQWHSEIFTLPKGALPLGGSPATPLLGFVWRERVWALGGHPEITQPLVEEFARTCWSEEWWKRQRETGADRYVQRPERMAEETAARLEESRPAIRALLGQWLA